MISEAQRQTSQTVAAHYFTVCLDRDPDFIAEFDDELTETYLMDEESVTPDMIRRALRRGTLENKITPVLLGSAFKNKGVQPLLDGVIDYLPSPLDVPPVHGIDPKTEGEADGGDQSREAAQAAIVADACRRIEASEDIHS